LYLAAQAGIRCVEFDVMLARCGTPVVIHDETLERTTEASGSVADWSWAQLRGLRLRDARGQLTGATLPSFSEVLTHCAALGLAANVEIKPSTGCARETGHAVAKATAGFMGLNPLKVLLTSFEREALDRGMAVAPDIPYGHLFDCDVASAIARDDLTAYSHLVFNHLHLTQDGVQQAMSEGFGVAVYTVNTSERARQLWSWGVGGVISDDPVALLPGTSGASLA